MSTPDSGSAPDEVSDEDWADQQRAAAPVEDEALPSSAQRGEADEADVVEQELDAYTADDEEDR